MLDGPSIKIEKSESTRAVNHFLVTVWIHLAKLLRLTFAGRRRDPNADKVLESQHAGQEAAILGPDLSNGFPPSFVHDCYQGKGMKHGIKVHTLPDYIDSQQQASLREKHEGTHEVMRP